MKTTRKKLLSPARVGLTVCLAAYLVGSLVVCAKASAEAVCTGLRVSVSDDSRRGFVTAREIARELGDLPRRAAGMRLADIDTEALTRRLADIDKIEDLSVIRTSQGLISVDVRPLVPVARVFDGKDSYYINRSGKRISANARYHSDVPVIQGHFSPADSLFRPESLLPLLDYIDSHERWRDLVTMVKADSPTDIILVPSISGHVINFGALEAFDSKFARLAKMYSKVLPAKGWNYYDTLSVKWSGQVVATRRVKPVDRGPADFADDDDDANVATMLAAEGVAPGQTHLGAKAKDDKPIPGAAAATKTTTTKP